MSAERSRSEESKSNSPTAVTSAGSEPEVVTMARCGVHAGERSGREPVEDVRAEPVTVGREVGMVEVVARVAGHAEPAHHPL